MVNPNPKQNVLVDPKSGYCYETRIYHSLRPRVLLPPETASISVADYALALHKSHPPPPDSFSLVDVASRRRFRFEEMERLVRTLPSSIRTRLGLLNGDTAFVLCDNSPQVVILYFALLSVGVVVSPSNTANTKPEISRQIELSKPVIAFASPDAAHEVPALRYGTILLDSPDFDALMSGHIGEMDSLVVHQSDTAVILYSLGTTGRLKGVALTHLKCIAAIAAAHAVRPMRKVSPVILSTVALFQIYGFGLFTRAVTMGETLAIAAGRLNLEAMFRRIEKLRVTHVALSPPVASAMARDQNLIAGYDLSSLEVLSSAGASLPKQVIHKLKEMFPKVQVLQAYGLTESSGRIFGTVGIR